MTINLYIDLMNERLAVEGHAPASYATAQHWHFAGKTPVETARIVIEARKMNPAAI